MIQELVLVLDGRNGLGLASYLFGASVFWVPAGHPNRVPKQPLRQPVEAAGEGLVCPFFGGLGRRKTGRNRPRFMSVGALNCMSWKARFGPREMPERQTGFTG